MTEKGTSKDAKPTRNDVEPMTGSGLADWFDRWPEMLSRRWPESFGAMPFADGAIRLEQFRDDDGTVVVRAELPGVDPDNDVEVSIDDGRLTIACEREERSEQREQGNYRSEFHYGSFERTVRLPAGAQAADVTADYRDGILEVRVPVDDERAAATKVPVTTQG